MAATETLAPPFDRCLELALGALDRLPPKTLRTLARHLRGADRLDDAQLVLDHLEATVGADDLSPLHDDRAALLEAQGRWVDARARRELRLLSQPDAVGRQALATHLLTRGDTESLLRLDAVMTEVERLDAGTLESTLLRIRHAVVRNRLAEARRLATQAIADHPRSARVLMVSAEIALLEGDRDAARGFLEQTLARSPRLGAQTREELLGLIHQIGGAEATAHAEATLPPPTVAPNDTLHRELAEALELGEVPEPERPERRRRESEPIQLDPASIPPTEQEMGRQDPEEIVLDEPMPDPRVLPLLREVFGYGTLRPGQATVISRLLQGQDTLAIMPTGAGKSLTFQLPALLIDGPTVVISPLIALMQDQVDSLPPQLKQQATFINGALEPMELERRISRLAAGEYKLLYVAPERLRHPAFLDALRTAGCARIVIDEAHCISLWGHDFRPDYLYIPHALQLLGDPPVLAVTATATPENANHVGKLLGRRLELVRTSAYRPNLRYEVIPTSGPKEKKATLAAILQERTGAAIVYVPTRKDAEEVATQLRAGGVNALPYHAGLASSVRSNHQDRFMRSECPVMVATVAFGMGIDKADVRTIVHYAPPRSLEAYVQEAGRAGRDGLPAACVLLVAKADFVRLRRHAGESDISVEDLREVYRSLRSAAIERWAVVDRSSFGGGDDQRFDPMVGIGLLEQAGLVRRHPDTAASFIVRWTERSAISDPLDDSPFERWLTRVATGSAAITVPTAAVCAELGIAPVRLEHLLRSRTGLRAAPQGSAICVELLPSDRSTPSRVNGVLAQLQRVAVDQLQAISRYIDGTDCRHAVLAAHLGERIPRCETACDICAPRAGARATFAAIDPTRRERHPRSSTRSASGSRASSSTTEGGPLFEALRSWRLERARQDGVPPYVVAYNSHLEDIARLRPTRPTGLRQVSGFGQSRIDKYGDEIVAVIATATSDR